MRFGMDDDLTHAPDWSLVRSFLAVLDETVATGKTAAENLLDLYNGAWHHDVTRVFRDFAY